MASSCRLSRRDWPGAAGGGVPAARGGAVKGPAGRAGAVAVRHGLPGLRAGVPGHAGRDAGLHHRLRAHHRRRGEGAGGPLQGGGGEVGVPAGVLRWGSRGVAAAAGSGCPAVGGSCSACLSQQLEFITPFQLYFNPDLIFRKFQVRPCPGFGAPLAPSWPGVGVTGWALGLPLPGAVRERCVVPGASSHCSAPCCWAGAGLPAWWPLLSQAPGWRSLLPAFPCHMPTWHFLLSCAQTPSLPCL